jgi:glycosyltransferase involved in cell wall biosynthesis
MLRDDRWGAWRYAPFWLEKMHQYSRCADRVVVISRQDRQAAALLLGLHQVEQIPNAVDTERFRPRLVRDDERLGYLQRWLVEQPQGWAAGRSVGSIAYSLADLARLRSPNGRLRPLLLWVGRFLDFKRLPLLIRAFARARERLDPAPALLVWGGHPGEYEGAHPEDVARMSGVRDDVFFLGWRDHDELPLGLNIADVMAAPAVDEPFGLVYLEAMACGTPVIATPTGGPADLVKPDGEHANGWFAAPDDESDLADQIVAAVRDEPGRLRRGQAAEQYVREGFSWRYVADEYLRVYEETTARLDRTRLATAGTSR